MNPTILHRGARNGVTGSCHQLFVEGDNSLLVDCGLFQGTETAPDGKAGADRLDIDFPVAGIGALILTHVHIDHCGRLPWLLAAGFKGPILCSEPSLWKRRGCFGGFSPSIICRGLRIRV